MKKLNLIQLSLICVILFSCHSKTEIKKQVLEQPRADYVIQNYKLDDDEIARREKETLAKKPIVKKDSIHTKK